MRRQDGVWGTCLGPENLAAVVVIAAVERLWVFCGLSYHKSNRFSPREDLLLKLRLATSSSRCPLTGLKPCLLERLGEALIAHWPLT